ncbi:uncharacterized protein N7459_000885 [Penicillium hispanicum]|uniref:uncharacterized protein n=1 Tax=Penicillium hispanicum TaxID=1080232 RepID=UPI002541960B|nr:uncharacterized protein N7459_000885 [Penicillium hispanicum]KAJ5594677.1 hypothetical protein N7459_000885 [Penicillium hispanicum]
MAVRVELGSTALLYTYFILTSAIGSVIFYTSSTEIRDLHYVDALFMACSAVTGTGLNVLDLSTLNRVQQGTLFTLLVVGHAIPILGVLSLIRAWTLRAGLKERSYRKRQDHILIPKSTLLIEREKVSENKENASTVKITTLPKITTRVRELPEDSLSSGEIDPCWNTHDSIIITNSASSGQRPQAPSITILGVAETVLDTKTRISRNITSLRHSIQRQAKRISSRSSIDSDEPGWIEYRALLLLSVLVLLYFLTFLLLGIASIGFWLAFARPDIPRANRVPPFWTGAFLATSAFANNGMSLIDTSMGPFQREPYTLLLCGFLVLAGNALFPCLLRSSLWLLSRIVPDKPAWHVWRRVLDYILRQSQSVVFLRSIRMRLSLTKSIVLILNGIMWGAFEVASIHSAEIGALPAKYRALDGLFQALSVRGGGFSVVAIDRLPQGLLILYALMMYLSAFPVSAVISAETLQTQREASCLEAGASSHPLTNDSNRSILARGHFICQQIHAQFSTDLWWLSLAVMLISIAESDHYKSNPIAFSTFNVIFEVVSAYSSIGISVGFPGKSYAFCGEWHTVSKLLLMAISLRGRHRGLSVLPGRNPSLVDPKTRPTSDGVQEKISDTQKPQ